MAKKKSEDIKPAQQELSLAIVQQLTKLATGGFSLVAALAWNNVIQETVNTYVKPYLARGSSVTSLLIYAILITVFAVVVTLQLTKMERKLTDINRTLKTKVHQAIKRKSAQ